MKRRLRKHRGWLAALIFGLLFLLAFFVYRTLFVAGTAEQVQYVTEAAEKGTLIVSVSGTGNAALGSSHDASPAVSGVVRGLNVKVGDAVTKGQVLFTLENGQLDMNVISAQVSYDQSRASLLNAEANVYQAEQSLDQLEGAADGGGSSPVTSTPPTGPPSTEPPTTRPPTTGPPITFPSTTSTTSPPAGTTSTSSPPAGTTSTSSPPTTAPPTTTTEPPATTTTRMSPPTSQASAMQATSLVFAAGATGGAIDAAGEIATPVVALSTPESGDAGATSAQNSNTVTGTDITVAKKKLAAAEASLAAAQGNLQVAEYNLEQSRIDAASRTVTAPADGVITELNVSEGATFGSTSGGTSGGGSGASSAAGGAADSTSSSSGAALTIVDPHSISAVVQLMESDIPQIEVGQKATLTFDAVPDLTFTGKVTAMDLIGTNTQGVVTFNVTVTPDSRDDRIRAGMTSYASIVTAVRQDVVLVPSGAVKSGTSGGSYVEVLVNGVPEQRDVTIGLSGDTQIEIASGLRAGDQVVTQTIDPNTTKTTTGSGGGFGIGGGFPGAGGPGR